MSSDIKKKKIISLLAPAFNEEENINVFYSEATEIMKKLKKYDYEILFVNDGSIDGTQRKIEALAEQDDHVHYIALSRNFGKEIALTAGIQSTKADAIIIVDVDLQYPLNKIPEFIKKWEEGYKVVSGIRDTKQSASLFSKIGSKGFYALMNFFSETKIRPNVIDFKLLDRVILDQFSVFTERGRIVRTLVDWLGHETAYVHYEEEPRRHGTTSFHPLKRINLALDAITTNSLLPLKFVGLLGMCITFLATLLIFWFLYDRWFRVEPYYFLSGTYLVGAMNMFFMGIVLIALGLVAYYIGIIKKEVLNRPLYTVMKSKI